MAKPDLLSCYGHTDFHVSAMQPARLTRDPRHVYALRVAAEVVLEFIYCLYIIFKFVQAHVTTMIGSSSCQASGRVHLDVL